MHYYEERRIDDTTSRVWLWIRTGPYSWEGRAVGYSYDCRKLNTNLTKIK